MVGRDEVERSIPDAGARYDVVVAGGGPAGLGAAFAAASSGARTLLLEERGFLGGVAPLALWMPVNRLMTGGRPRGGAHDALVDAVKALGAAAWREGKVTFIDADGLHIHPDYLRLALFTMLEKAGCHYKLYSPIVDVTLEGRAVTGVVTRHSGVSESFPAACVVDATGDGVVAFLSGAEVMVGREDDGRSMPISLVFAVANADIDRLLAWRKDDPEDYQRRLDEAAAEGYAVAAWYSFDRTTVPGVISINNGAWKDIGNLNGSDARDLTIAERFGALVAVDFVRLARAKRFPGLEDCALVRTGAAVGVRDTRRVVGDYVQSFEDAQKGAEFEDVVARKYGAVDANQLYVGPMASGYAYPYRSLLPKGVENLLVAGRCGSASFLGHAAGKSMGNMMALGQAAGAAAALSAAGRVSPRGLAAAAVQRRLAEMGVDLSPPAR